MKLRKVNITQVRVPETRVTAVYDEETLKLLRDTVDKLGILQPIILVAREEGFDLVDGLHRLEEAKRAGEVLVDAVVYQGGPEEALLMNLVLNRVRGKTRASEMMAVIGALYKDYGVDIEGIVEKTGLGQYYIEKMIRISEAAPSVREALDLELIGVSAAFEISRLPHVTQQDELIDKQRIYKWSVQDLKGLVDATIQGEQEIRDRGEPPKRVVVPPTYHCEGCKEEVPPRYLRPVMLCPNCYGAVWRLARAQGPETEALPADEG